MCQVLELSRSAYYGWIRSQESPSKQEAKRLEERIKLIFTSNRGNYGTRRIKKALAKASLVVSRRRIARMMKEAGLVCKAKRKFKVTTDSKHHHPISPNILKRNFHFKKPNQAYVGDITYIPTREGWLYLAVVIDLFSRQIVGWSMDKHMKASLVNNALLMSIWKRKPKEGLICHTDRGSQYASKSHRKIMTKYGIRQSMSRKGNCWDNAVAESFFHTLKVELVHQKIFITRKEAKYAIFEYIEVYYNRLRMHSANDYLSPAEYELMQNDA